MFPVISFALENSGARDERYSINLRKMHFAPTLFCVAQSKDIQITVYSATWPLDTRSGTLSDPTRAENTGPEVSMNPLELLLDWLLFKG